MNYERSIFVKCLCGVINELPLDEANPIEITGKPKNIAECKCVCGSEIIVFASIWIKKMGEQTKVI